MAVLLYGMGVSPISSSSAFVRSSRLMAASAASRSSGAIAASAFFPPPAGFGRALLVLPVSVLADRLWPLPAAAYTPFAVTLVSLALTMELWQLVQASRYRVARAFLLPGLALQRLTTREPAQDETQLALTAVASVLQRQLY